MKHDGPKKRTPMVSIHSHSNRCMTKALLVVYAHITSSPVLTRCASADARLRVHARLGNYAKQTSSSRCTPLPVPDTCLYPCVRVGPCRAQPCAIFTSSSVQPWTANASDIADEMAGTCSAPLMHSTWSTTPRPCLTICTSESTLQTSQSGRSDDVFSAGRGYAWQLVPSRGKGALQGCGVDKW